MNVKLIELVKTLIERSNQKDVIWNKTSSNNEFKVTLDEGTALTIDFYSTEYDICVYNKSGTLIIRHIVDSRDEGYDLLNRLHSAARESYYKVDDTLDNMIFELKTKSIVGNEESETPPGLDDDNLPF